MTIGYSSKLGYILLLIGGIIVFAFRGLVGSIVGACFATAGYVLALSAIVGAIKLSNSYLAIWDYKEFGHSSVSYVRILWWAKLVLIVGIVYPGIMNFAKYSGDWNELIYAVILLLVISYAVFLYLISASPMSSLEGKARIYQMLNAESNAVLSGYRVSILNILFPNLFKPKKERRHSVEDMDRNKFKWMMIAICVVSISASCAYIFRNAFSSSKNTSTAHHSRIGEYCYIDNFDIVHIDRLCKKLNYKGMTHTRVRPTELFSRGRIIEGYCPTCVNDEDFRILKIFHSRRSLYVELSKTYDLGGFGEFCEDIADDRKRKKLYDALIRDGYEMEPYDEFEANIGFGNTPPK